MKSIKNGMIHSLGVLMGAGLLSAGVAADEPTYYEITNGNLTVYVRTDNGSIDDYIFDGNNFFSWGSHVADWGMQLGTDTDTFRLNSTNGGTALPAIGGGNEAARGVAVERGVVAAHADLSISVDQISGSEVRVSGNYSAGGADIDYVRTLRVLPGVDALLFSYEVTNNGDDEVEVALFETFDPDQGQNSGNGYGTYNDVVTEGDTTYGIAADETDLSFVIGSSDSDVTVAAGSPFNIGNGNTLNAFFDAPYDGEGSFADEGVHLGVRKTLEPGETVFVSAAGSAATAQDDAIDQFYAGLGAEEETPVGGVGVTDFCTLCWHHDAESRSAGGSVGMAYYLILLLAGLGLRRRKL